MARRVSRRYDGTAPTSQKLQELLPAFLKEVGVRAKQEHLAVFSAWREAIGEKMAPLAEPILWEDAVLTVKVKSATLYSLLCQHEGKRLFQEMRKKFLIRKILYRI